jgi:cyclophilin family peptidyl-prolyl cis-trans isomerase
MKLNPRVTKFSMALLVIVISILFLPACSNSSTPKIKSWSSPPAMTTDQNKTYTATMKTNYGDIVIQLFPKEAPVTVNNFVFLARQGFYDGVKFHRVINGFMIQGGDPTGTGMGGPGYQFKDELPTTRSYTKGIIAMANAGANTNGSQFFIMLADYPLAKNYSIFGQVTGGQDVVDKIGNVPVDDPNSQSPKPTVDVHINTITITEK